MKLMSIKNEVSASYNEKGSKFIGYAFPMKNEEVFESTLKRLRSEHNKARHHCYAYRLGQDEIIERSSDDGEPSGTAGLPIMNQIKSFELSDIGLIIVRYFGGTKLGVSGLIRAYKSAALNALELAEAYVPKVYVLLEIVYSMSEISLLMSVLDKYDIQRMEEVYGERSSLLIKLEEKDLQPLLEQLDRIPNVDASQKK